MNSKNMTALPPMLLFALMMVASPVWANRSGAPLEACGDMKPQHGVDSQKTPAPYQMKVTKTGDQYELLITGNTPKDTIKGFLVQAKQDKKLVGQFVIGKGDKFMHFLKCGTEQDKRATVTHRAYDPAQPKLTFKWKPNGAKGTVRFYATILLNGGTFWVAVPSAPFELA